MLIAISRFENFIEGRVWHIRDQHGWTPHTAKITNGESIFDDYIVYGVIESEALEKAHALAPILRGINSEHPIAQQFRKHNAVIREDLNYQYVYVQTEILARHPKNDTEYARKVGGSAFLSAPARWVKNYLYEQEAFIQTYKNYPNVEIQEDNSEFRAVRTTKQVFGHRLVRELIALGVPFEGRNVIPDTYSSIEEFQRFNQFYGFYEDAKKIIDPNLYPPIVIYRGVDLLPYTHIYLKRKSKPVPVIKEKAPIVLPNLLKRPLFIRRKNNAI